jgi:hypothetical protein
MNTCDDCIPPSYVKYAESRGLFPNPASHFFLVSDEYIAVCEYHSIRHQVLSSPIASIDEYETYKILKS